ncbi:hypothetical protein C9J12_29080, partial [Photobacterium frigidiphilum]
TLMLRWPLATVKWRAACAERCTCGSVRRGREIVRLRSVSYSTQRQRPSVNMDYLRKWLLTAAIPMR